MDGEEDARLMATTAHELGELLARMERLERKLDAALAPRSMPELVSKRRAARLLGVNRDETLEELIRSGRLIPVYVRNRARIPLAQIRRLLEQGDAPPPAPVRPTRARRAPAGTPTVRGVGDAIRKIKL
jgi:hypothetical protein